MTFRSFRRRPDRRAASRFIQDGADDLSKSFARVRLGNQLVTALVEAMLMDRVLGESGGKDDPQVLVHALQVLQGQKVHILPVREAKKISLKINQKTADQLELTIPSDIASKAQIVK